MYLRRGDHRLSNRQFMLASHGTRRNIVKTTSEIVVVLKMRTHSC